MIIEPFPHIGPHMYDAINQLTRATQRVPPPGTPALADLPKPWIPSTCHTPALRAEVWRWLDDVVIWLNHQMTWLAADQIPACWPKHPQLVHEIGPLAEQRRLAEQDPTPHALEEWHRYAWPAFTTRIRPHIQSCADKHTAWPGKASHTRATDPEHCEIRQQQLLNDIRSMPVAPAANRPLRLVTGETVDPGTGEIIGDDFPTELLDVLWDDQG